MSEWNAEALNQYRESRRRREPGKGCIHCAYFKITWDPKHPRACGLFGFSGPGMPSDTVKAATGRECPAFTPKQIPGK